jgi:hypothetical protein
MHVIMYIYDNPFSFFPSLSFFFLLGFLFSETVITLAMAL